MIGFDEYLQVTDPKRFVDVRLKKSDLVDKVKVIGGYEVTLMIHGVPYIYLVRPGETQLHVIDTYGNLRNLSCFQLNKPLEPKREVTTP